MNATASEREKGSRVVLYAALAGNALVAVTKFVAAGITGSAAMLGEAVHSLADTSNELLLLYGERRSRKPPDRTHPFGYGREVYFWSFMVSVVLFALGAGVSIWEGVRHVLAPHEVERPLVSYTVLGIAAIFESGSWWFAFREFRSRTAGRGMLETARETKDPSTIMVFLEDSAALIGIALAVAGTAAAQLLGEPVFDGAASIAIGVLLAVVALFTARENKQLLIGEAARPSLVDAIGRIARTQAGVAAYNALLTIQLAPHEVVAALSVDFDDSLRASEVQRVVRSLESRIRQRHPEVVMVLVKPQDPEAYRKAHERWMAGS
ncbi:MAG TPA: cation diffusion facilitator family transporter [Usitatibacter sp.]|nr:cation diffusion facilitator family transporter [Usitatibacter sp.]